MTFAADLYKRAIVPLRTKAPEQNLHRGFSRTVNLYQRCEHLREVLAKRGLLRYRA